MTNQCRVRGWVTLIADKKQWWISFLHPTLLLPPSILPVTHSLSLPPPLPRTQPLITVIGGFRGDMAERQKGGEKKERKRGREVSRGQRPGPFHSPSARYVYSLLRFFFCHPTSKSRCMHLLWLPWCSAHLQHQSGLDVQTKYQVSKGSISPLFTSLPLSFLSFFPSLCNHSCCVLS